MKPTINLDEFIPQLDKPEKVYQLFQYLGFKVLDSKLKTKPSVYGLPAKESNLIENIYAVSNYGRRFQILLIKLKEENKEIIRTIPEKILREVDFPFIIFTPDFKTYTFTLVEKVREGPGEFKRKLTKLVVDSSQPYHTDKEILSSLALSADVKNPVEVYKLFQSAFNVERVTKKFFTEYREVFEKLSKEITKQNRHLRFTLFLHEASVENFTKILLGRLMFLYFIQKRGWLNCFDGWGSGDKKFLYNKFQEAKKEKKNYFKNYLEPLFFDTLNNPRRDKPDQATQFGGRIPFLNGGLFEPNYNYEDPSQIVVIDNDSFEQVFSVFEKYNFTVKEDEPLEKEVAIDPEMLGKVFENLLEENLRKGKGTYYTPREIVHYMCHESLINYLASEIKIDQEVVRNFLDREQSLEKKETLSSAIREKAREIDKKLESIKVLDPACGSGAFLVGMLHEVINARLSLNRELGRSLSEYELKKATIQNNIYGVDIDPGATEIAKLRLWLTLVVDHNLSEIEPLPNLDYKIMVGNSLIEDVFVNGKFIKLFNYEFIQEKQGKKMKNLFDEETQADLFDNLHWQNIQPEVEQIIKKKKQMFDTFEFEKKQKLRREIDNLENELIRKSLKYEAQILQERIVNERQNSDLRTDKQNKEMLNLQFSKSFLDELINSDKKLNEYKSSNLFLWKLRFIEVFDEKGGFDVVIANPPYGSNIKGGLRNAIVNHLGKVPDFEIYYFFIERGKELLHEKGLLTYIIPNTFLFNVFANQYRANLLNDWSIKGIIDCTNFKLFESATVYNAIILFNKNGNKNLVGYKNTQNASNFNELVARETLLIKPEVLLIYNQNWGLVFKLPEEVLKIIEKIKTQTSDLRHYFPEISQGLIAYDKYRGQKKEIIENRAYHYIKKIRTDLKPWLHGGDVKRYIVNWNGKEWIDYSKEIANPRQPKFFKGKRVLVREITNPSIYAGFTEDELYSDPSIITVLDNPNGAVSLLYLLGVLNSKLATFYHFNASPKATKGAFPKILVKDIQEFPIKEAPDREQNAFIEIVKKIIDLRKSNSDKAKKEAQNYEKQIDQLVYKLYGLAPEEIEIVENQ